MGTARDPKGRYVGGLRLADLQEVMNMGAQGRAAKKYSHLRVELPTGEELSLLFTDHEIREAVRRAKNNPEDIPPVSWLRDLLD